MAKAGGADFDMLFQEWRRKFRSVAPLPQDPADFDSLQRVLQDLTTQYSRKPLSKCLAKLQPTLEHVKSFSGALNSICQVQDATTLTWGALQVMIECVCKHSNAIEDIFDIIADVNTILPRFQRGLALYPNAKALSFPLHDLLRDYLAFCILITKHVTESPLKNFLKGLFRSKLKSEVTSLKKSMERNEDIFQKELQSIDRETVQQQGIDNATSLGKQSQAIRAKMLQTTSQTNLPFNTIPTLLNQQFVGREDELKDLHDHLDPGNRQSGRAYVNRYLSSYDGCFWLNSETDHELRKSYAEIGKKIQKRDGYDIVGGQSSPEDEIGRAVECAREWLESTNEKWLLVFDNLENARHVQYYLPDNIKGCGATIITTQKAHISKLTANFHKIELQEMSPDVGAELLLKLLDERPHVSDDDRYVAREVSEWVGGLPLALVTIGGYVKTSGTEISKVFARLKRSSRVWADRGDDAVHNYQKTLATVFNVALGALSPNARHFIDLMAFLNPDRTPEELFTQPQKVKTLEFLNDEDEFLDIGRDLGRRQLFKRFDSPDGVQYSVHRSLQKNILHGFQQDKDPDKRRRIFEEVFAMINQQLPPASRLQQNESDIWPVYHKFVPQVVSVMTNSRWPDPPLELNLKFAKMLSNVGTYLWHTGQFRDCEIAMEEAETALLKQDDQFKNSPEFEELISDIYLVTGIVADCVGVSKRKESLQHREELLRLRNNELDRIPVDQRTTDDEIRWGNAKGDLACAYFQRDRYAEAKVLMEELLVYYRKWGTENQYPFEYSKYYHHSAFILMTEGQPRQALDYVRKSLNLELQHAGSEDSSVLITKYDLALITLRNALRDDTELHGRKKDIQGHSTGILRFFSLLVR
ncbi:hypothetical protein GT037_005674 [Alternaria burnsii]|uniref:NB-ARC domain-containing protein n=1 Tax=Alternaria burnsii TaxID=1187904 RepID=A0A8H7B6D5_9PLEO|nr:uncharacterized protein GT037_005674 [Alternaria burnsii]KAF7676169.1 hypothetical protein GT037_005674 [Alternaria burnsii]